MHVFFIFPLGKSHSLKRPGFEADFSLSDILSNCFLSFRGVWMLLSSRHTLLERYVSGGWKDIKGKPWSTLNLCRQIGGGDCSFSHFPLLQTHQYAKEHSAMFWVQDRQSEMCPHMYEKFSADVWIFPIYMTDCRDSEEAVALILMQSLQLSFFFSFSILFFTFKILH